MTTNDPGALLERHAGDTRAAIAQAVDALTAARITLIAVLTAACPGPHKPTQHRDRRPPWCKACRYTVDGTHVPQQKGTGCNPSST